MKINKGMIVLPVLIALFSVFTISYGIENVNGSEERFQNGQVDDAVNMDDDGSSANRADSLYSCDYECNSLTTSGMVEWSVKMTQKEKHGIEVWSGKIKKESLGDTKNAVEKELAAWNDVSKSFDKLSSCVLDLYWWFGSSMGSVVIAGTPLDFNYARHACLKEDYPLFRGGANNNCSFTEDLNLSGLFNAVDTVIQAVSTDSVDWSFNEDGYIRNKSEYQQKFNSCKGLKDRFRTDMEVWIRARNDVAETLDADAGRCYRKHTWKVVNSVTDIFRHFIEY